MGILDPSSRLSAAFLAAARLDSARALASGQESDVLNSLVRAQPGAEAGAQPCDERDSMCIDADTPLPGGIPHHPSNSSEGLHSLQSRVE